MTAAHTALPESMTGENESLWDIERFLLRFGVFYGILFKISYG